MKRLKILIPILLSTPTYQVLAYNPDYAAWGGAGTGTCPENYRSVTSEEARNPSFLPVVERMDRTKRTSIYLIDNGRTSMTLDGGSAYIFPIPASDSERNYQQILCYLTNTAILERLSGTTEPTISPARLGSQYSLSSRTASKNWIVDNVKEYKVEVVDDTAVIGNHAPTYIGSASSLGEMTLLSEISKVFSEDSPASIPKEELKVTKNSLKLPNSIAGVVKDGMESVISLEEILAARESAVEAAKEVKSAAAERTIRQIDTLIDEVAGEVSSARPRPFNHNLLSGYKDQLKGITSADGKLDLYQKIQQRLQNSSLDQYKTAAQNIDDSMKKYRADIDYKPNKKLSSYSSAAKPKVKALKVVKGITSSLSVAGDIIGFALDIALMMEEKPDQFVYVGAAATNQETANGYATSIIREALAVKGLSETYKARTEAMAKAIQVLNPIFLPTSEYLGTNEQRWTNVLWILNEKALLQDLNKGQVIFGDYTRDGTRTKWYPEKLPDTVEPLSSELNNAKYGLQQSSTLVAMLGTVESGRDYDPQLENTIAYNSFKTYENSVVSTINSKPSQEAFSWALSEYFKSASELKDEVERFKSYSNLYKTAVLWALYEASNSNFLNEDMSYFSEDFDFIYNKATKLRDYYGNLVSDASPTGKETLTIDITNAANELLDIINSSINNLTDNQVIALLEIIQQQANNEVFGRNRDDSWYQLFQEEGESQADNTTRLVGLFEYAIGAVTEDSATSIDKANIIANESLLAVEGIAENWVASDVFKIKGNYYTPLGAMDQIVFEAASGGETGPYRYDRVNNTVGEDVNAHSYFFDVLNHPLYRDLVKKRDIKYPHWRGWYGTATSDYDVAQESKFNNWIYVDLSHQKLINQAIAVMGWKRRHSLSGYPEFLPDTATFGMPLPTKSNSDSIGDVSAYSVMDSLGAALTYYRDLNDVPNTYDVVNSIHSYKNLYHAPTGRKVHTEDTWKWFTWND
ncbi:hypothetical protein [Vibrio sp. B183]|uniref:hypothetical protein n=1 Tax=Vibrio sp. B183 TaxID=1526762 RepID=UPI000A4F43ED|nr:hypothetical protein [Vibrio sp. B183]